MAIELADTEGLGAVSMRVLAKRLGIAAMSLYTYVANRNDLVVLMVDHVIGRRALPPMEGSLRERLRLVAEVQLADDREHPWLLDVSGVRPWLGPGVGDRYEWLLSAVEGVGLDDVEMDQTVTLVVGFAANVARSEHAVRVAERESGATDLEWWEANSGPLGESPRTATTRWPAGSGRRRGRPTRPAPTPAASRLRPRTHPRRRRGLRQKPVRSAGRPACPGRSAPRPRTCPARPRSARRHRPRPTRSGRRGQGGTRSGPGCRGCRRDLLRSRRLRGADHRGTAGDVLVMAETA